MSLNFKVADNGLKIGYYQVIVEGVYLIPKQYLDRASARSEAEHEVRNNIDFIIEYVAESIEYYTEKLKETGWKKGAYTEWKQCLSDNKKALKKLTAYRTSCPL